MNWKQFDRANNLLGWGVFLIATLTYLLTIGPSASLWDCAEFIACDYKLEIGHPPGAPFYMLVYNVVSHLGGGVQHAALLTNATSAVLSGFTILFLFWTITHMVRRVLTPGVRLGLHGAAPEGQVLSLGQGIAILGAGLVGSLVYTFSDSFWFSAVEAEVYAFSSLFTAVVFWLIFKWDERSENERSDRWLILIAYLMGLSIGVHLLNLLCLPAMALVYYYRRSSSPSLKGAGLALLASFALVGVMMYGVVQGVPKLAGMWDMFFVNQLGLSYNQGLYIYLIVLAAVLLWGVVRTQRALSLGAQALSLTSRASIALSLILLGVPLLGGGGLLSLVLVVGIAAALYYYKALSPRLAHTLQMSLVAIMVGFSSYGVILVRAEADPPMNENSPADAFSLRYYLAREQYGSAPLIYGQTFASRIKYGSDGRPVMKEGEPTYGRIDKAQPSDPDRYVVRSLKEEPQYEESEMMLFPRVYDRGHAQMYNSWMGRAEDDMSVPSFAENLSYFFNYQVNYMYWRYFLWNFSGRQNDLQGDGSLLRGGAVTGIPFVDALFYGDSDSLPELVTANKGHNVYYALPLLLGLLGLFYQIGAGRRGTESFWVTFLLFFMTGLAIVLYLNQYPGQPRERDYAYVGSFYAFAIWVGFGVAALVQGASQLLASKEAKAKAQRDKQPLAINGSYAAIVVLLCLLVPLQMMGQNWDDHDRSGRTVASDMGRNYLESCEPNGILFCYGDNDTFPLWYAQEVEGVRTDVRTVNLSYLSGDWYIDQMKKQAYEGKPLPLGLLPASYYYYHTYALLGNGSQGEPMTVAEAFAALKDSPRKEPALLPTMELAEPVDSLRAAALLQRSAPDFKHMEPLKRFPMSLAGRSYADIGTMSVLDLIAGNKWERPIYWAITSPRNAFNNLSQYTTQIGMLHQLLPIGEKTSDPSLSAFDLSSAYKEDGEGFKIANLDRMYELVMTKFRWGGADRPGTYFDENARGIISTLRNQVFTPLAEGLLQRAAAGDKAKAQTVLRKCLSVILEENIPYETSSIYFARALYSAGLTKEADHVLSAIVRRSLSTMAWALRLSPEQLQQFQRYGDMQEAFLGLRYSLSVAEEAGSEGLKHYEAQIATVLRALGIAPQPAPQPVDQHQDSAQDSLQH